MYSVLRGPGSSSEYPVDVVHIKPNRCFSPRYVFVVNEKPHATVPIVFVSRNFITWFLRDATPEDLTETSVRLVSRIFDEAVYDQYIAEECGAPDVIQTPLSTIWAFLAQYTAVCTDTRTHIFYTPDTSGIVRAVYLCESSRGWGICSDPVGFDRPWKAGSVVHYPESCHRAVILPKCA